MSKDRVLSPLLILAICVLFFGCKDKNSIQTYRVSKEEPSASNKSLLGPGEGSLAKQDDPGRQDAAVDNLIPQGWETKPASPMRQASYLAKGKDGSQADISLIILAGTAGGTLDNVNRWLDQLGQPAVTQEQLATMIQTVEAPLGKVTVVDLQGKPATGDASKDGRIIAGMVGGEGGSTWFFKMRGNPGVVGAEKEHFLKWITTVKRAPAQGAPANAVPQAEGDQQAKPKVAWTLPVDWKPVQGSQMRYASFSAAGDNGAVADISVSFFPGSVGGDLGNVNRWRNQIGLSPVTEADLATLIVPVTGKAGEIKTVEFAGADAKVLAAWIPVDGNTWFFKLTAPAPLADRQKEAFLSFLQSVDFHQ